MNILGPIWMENMLNCSQFADNDSKIWKIQKNVFGMHNVFKCNVHCFKTFFGSLCTFFLHLDVQNELNPEIILGGISGYKKCRIKE